MVSATLDRISKRSPLFNQENSGAPKKNEFNLDFGVSLYKLELKAN